MSLDVAPVWFEISFDNPGAETSGGAVCEGEDSIEFQALGRVLRDPVTATGIQLRFFGSKVH